MVFRPPGPILDNQGPLPEGPIWPQNAHKTAKMGPKNGLKARKNRKILFCSESLPEGSWMVSRPQNPLKTCNGPQIRSFWTRFACKIGQKGPKKHVFLK